MRYLVIAVALAVCLVVAGCGRSSTSGERSIRACGPGESIPPGPYPTDSVSSGQTWVWTAPRPIEEVVVQPPLWLDGGVHHPAQLGADYSGTFSGDTVRIWFRAGAGGGYAVKIVYRGGEAPPDVRVVLVDTELAKLSPWRLRHRRLVNPRLSFLPQC
jgi:hypothetical protein